MPFLKDKEYPILVKNMENPSFAKMMKSFYYRYFYALNMESLWATMSDGLKRCYHGNVRTHHLYSL